MAKVGIVMGSDSDMPVMSKAAEILDKLGIDYEMRIISAHRGAGYFLRVCEGRRGERGKGDHCRSRKGGAFFPVCARRFSPCLSSGSP